MSRTHQPLTGRQPAERPNGRGVFAVMSTGSAMEAADIGGAYGTDITCADKPEGLSFGLPSGGQLPSREAHIP